MAINIFQGQASKKGVNSAANSTRAQAAKAAISGPAQTSDSGNVAVKTGSTLSKVGNTVGKVAGIAAKFLPGVGGVVAKGLSNLLNDPEWWQSVPGEAISCNVPLRATEVGEFEDDVAKYDLRPALLEVASCQKRPNTGDDIGATDEPDKVISVTDQMVTQYLMPQIRKVVNAIPLQDAAAYKEVLEVNCTLYALWRNLLKYDYMLKHGQTYLPNMNVGNFPVLLVSEAAWLQSTINRLEEYLRANVRLPHTMCCYLAWRYGRIYKSTDSAKSALVMYNVYPLDTPITSTAAFRGYTNCIQTLMTRISSDERYQKANTDLYNAYVDHDMQVIIRDDTQFTYDRKEFALRTNMDKRTVTTDETDPAVNYARVPIYIDSNLDNVTAFMASTVSTTAVTADLETEKSVLFPVHAVFAHVFNTVLSSVGLESTSTGWLRFQLKPQRIVVESGSNPATLAAFMTRLGLAKALDLYNADMSIQAQAGEAVVYVDLTALSSDCGTIAPTVLQNEHVFAFANLVHVDRKRSETYNEAEKQVAKETANLIDKLDVAAPAAPAVAKPAMTPAAAAVGK